MNLNRFFIAQADPATGFDVAIAELRRGRKVSHWIWYIFPQLRGLGRSEMAQFYAIDGLDEAQAYLREPTLSRNLVTALRVVADHLDAGARIDTLMGSSIDSSKLVSCVTLFRHAAENARDPSLASDIQELADRILSAAETQGYPECPQTLALLR